MCCCIIHALLSLAVSLASKCVAPWCNSVFPVSVHLNGIMHYLMSEVACSAKKGVYGTCHLVFHHNCVDMLNVVFHVQVLYITASVLSALASQHGHWSGGS